MNEGSLELGNGFEILVDAMHLMPWSNTCIVIGDGSLREELETSTPDNLKFLGELDSKYTAELMRQSSWYVFSSITPVANAISAVRAIACGARIIAPNHSSISESFGPCGLLYKSGNIESLVVTIINAIEREDMLGFTEKERHEHLSKYSVEKPFNSIMQVLHN